MTPRNEPLSLYWLPPAEDFDAAIEEARGEDGGPERLLARLMSLANRRIDFLQTRRLDRLLGRTQDRLPAQMPRLRLALLGSSTLDFIVPGIRIGALRRGLLVDVLVTPFGQWRQQILDPESELYAFEPNAVLLALDHAALLPALPPTAPAEDIAMAVDAAVEELAGLWRMVRERSQASIIQQTLWTDEPPLFGHFERLVPASPGALSSRFDGRLAETAAKNGVLLLDLRAGALDIGTRHLGDPALWHHAKQAIPPTAVPWVGDHVGRILAALRGLSRKALVLDLDNTLWGGTIGDDGVDGIVLGQGSGAGEAFTAFQRYVRKLADRGIVLAVSSKNDAATAEAAFAEHPEMVLGLGDFAAFEVSWNDKPSAVRRIADELDLGLSALVFVDDNPVERALMRRTLPEVAVPELPEAPELFARCLADAGYFEAVSFTPEDAGRNAQYVANRERHRLQSAATDMEGFLRELQMTLTIGPFTPAELPRIAQLVNKTNQFNLTTRRYTEPELRALMKDPSVQTFAARLSDRFGDNGLIAVIIGRWLPNGASTIEIDSWLMSCRILGRRVEQALLAIVAQEAIGAGAARMLGVHRPTRRNGIVKEFYSSLGFEPAGTDPESGETKWVLSLQTAKLPATDHLTVVHRSEVHA